MIYRAVGNRCAVDFDSLNLHLPKDTMLATLRQQGFQSIEVNLIEEARRCIENSKYRRGARPSEAPAVLDCSSFMKWLYSLRGIWLPRRSIQQRECGEVVELHELQAGDIIFTSGVIDYYYDDPRDGVGHVGIATGVGTIIHAANSRVHIIESDVNDFTDTESFRGARRLIPHDKQVITFLTPPAREVETSDDVRWIILQTLPRS